MARALQKVSVDLFYDVISPYSYIAFETLSRVKKRSDMINLKLQPSLLGGILKSSGNQIPITVPAKAKYIMSDVERLCRYYNIPYNFPSTALPMIHRNGSLIIQRLLLAVKENYPDNLEPLTRAIYRALFSEDINVCEPDNLIKACKSVGFSENDSEILLFLTKDSKIKQILKDQVQMAVDCGAFGLPTFVAHYQIGPEMYFGCDRLDLLLHNLKIPYKDAFTV